MTPHTSSTSPTSSSNGTTTTQALPSFWVDLLSVIEGPPNSHSFDTSEFMDELQSQTTVTNVQSAELLTNHALAVHTTEGIKFLHSFKTHGDLSGGTGFVTAIKGIDPEAKLVEVPIKSLFRGKNIMAPLAAPEDIIKDFLNKREINFPAAGGMKGATYVPSVALMSYPMLMSLTGGGMEVLEFDVTSVLGAVAEDSAQMLRESLGTAAEDIKSADDLINEVQHQGKQIPHSTTLQVISCWTKTHLSNKLNPNAVSKDLSPDQLSDESVTERINAFESLKREHRDDLTDRDQSASPKGKSPPKTKQDGAFNPGEEVAVLVDNEFCGTATIIGAVEDGMLGTEYKVRDAQGVETTRTTHELKRMKTATKRTAPNPPTTSPPAKRSALLARLQGNTRSKKVVIEEQTNTNYGVAKAAADADFVAGNHHETNQQRTANSRWNRPREAGRPQGLFRGLARREEDPPRAAARGDNNARVRQALGQDPLERVLERLVANQERTDETIRLQISAAEDANRIAASRLLYQSSGAKPLSTAALTRYANFATSDIGLAAAGVTTLANKIHGYPAKRALEELQAAMLDVGFIAANFHPTAIEVEALRLAKFTPPIDGPAPFGPFTLCGSNESILADLMIPEFFALSSADENALSEPRRAQFERAQALLKKTKIVVAPSLQELGDTLKLLAACAKAHLGSLSRISKWASAWLDFVTKDPSKSALQRLQLEYDAFHDLPMLLQLSMDRQIANYSQCSQQGPPDGAALATDQLFESFLSGSASVNIPRFVKDSLTNRAAVRAERDRIDRDHQIAQREYQPPAFQFPPPPRQPPRRWDNPPQSFPPPPPPGRSPYQPAPPAATPVHPALACSEEMYRQVIGPCLGTGRVRPPLFNDPHCSTERQSASEDSSRAGAAATPVHP
ncbi:hypothetical protein THAOC_17825 [Thalassiosira oceanica]|uniref:Uncharacterized protein n=1 Tax=Thalassiosira oceanica TaxID=159749 RepID=K0S8M9_THAOC|nr:hypothetical protein THAOC_17825 [Thalassiosira oceanica]|eukprot:EJK61650.1 hypothetical protein THAOC_17825 [Thalassiosira oceanica]